MSGQLPVTPQTLLAKLRDADEPLWQSSWRRFLELYREPIEVIARACYRYHTSGAIPSTSFIEEVVARVVADFASNGHRRYEPEKGRLRTYLRMVVNARVVDLLRKERPLDHQDDKAFELLPAASEEEEDSFQQSVLNNLVEELRETIALRQFEIFEMVKLKGLPPEQVAVELGVKRGVVDNTVFKVMTKLRTLAASREYQEEYYA